MSEVLHAKVTESEKHGISRRRVVAGVAWSLPVIATAIAAPAAAASGLSATTLLSAASTISIASSATGQGTSRTGTGPANFQIINSGSAITGAITGTVNIKPVGTVSAGVGVHSITSATLTSAAYTSAHEYNATFTLAAQEVPAGQTVSVPIFFQYERVNPAPSGILTYVLTITLRLPDNTDRVITGTVTITY
ncbi:hypothetical protein [Pseudarthrobacter oxydans]|uniref:hypothetical protein n=1 Tax=Pseudarthrobacter oxydans TaxID=1671 RepID=UPI002AA661A9|nr:hypothetical protein [Pseudarthrobacter oxydans]WPU08601.1 hypothetical protein SMD14_15815 [Pseudarthrobacter oxydans]